MKYDATLKKLFQRPPNRLLAYALGGPVAVQRALPTEQIRIENLHPDLLLETDDGRILHVELQGYPQADFACRNLLYFGLVLRDHGKAPKQIVFWIGESRVGVKEGIEIPPDLTYQYTVVDVRQIDPEFLLESDEPSEWVFAILCKLRDPAAGVARILRLLSTRPLDQQREGILQLLVLSGLRGLKSVVQSEVQRMPVSIDIHENEFLEEIYQEGQQKGIEKGIEKGREQERAAVCDSARALLTDMLREKFGAIPSAIENRLSAADLPQLQRWTRRVLTATSLNETVD